MLMNALGTKKGDDKDGDEKKKGSEGVEQIGFNRPSMPEHLPSSGTYLLTTYEQEIDGGSYK